MPKAPGGYPPGAFGVQGNKPLSLALLDSSPSRGASGETVYFEGTAKASPIRGGGTPQA